MQAEAPVLRPAEEEDRDAIARIWHAGASLPGVGPASMPSEAELRSRLDAEIAGGWQVTVATRAGALIGFVAVKPAEAVLAELFVDPAAIGTGVGGALFAHAAAAMPDGFSLLTRTANLRARRFYEKAGMVVLREGTHPRSGDSILYYGTHPGG